MSDTFYTVNANRAKKVWRLVSQNTDGVRLCTQRASEVCRVTSREGTALQQGICKNMK